MKKGIVGGTFDPIHNGHLYIAYEAMYRLNLDKIIFMPSGNPPHKTDKKITEADVRYKLIKMAIHDEPSFEISDYEIKKQGMSYTFETMEHFKSLEPDVSWYFITGADCLRDLHLWKNVDKILDTCTFVVFNRPGLDVSKLMKEKSRIELLYNKKIIFLELLQLEISSSIIRQYIKEKKNIKYFLSEEVYKTILELGLYRGE